MSRLTLVLAPLFALASSVVAPAFASSEGAQLAVIAAHPDQWYWFTVLLLISSVLLVPALLYIARLAGGGLGAIGGALSVLGAIIAVGDVMSQFTLWRMIGPDANRGQMTALLDRVDNAAGVSIVYTIGGLSVLAGVVLLAIGLIRGRRAPAWAAVGLPVACVVNVVGFEAASNAVVAVSWVMLLLAMGGIAWQRDGMEARLARPVEVM
jgi:hypothetical protein